MMTDGLGLLGGTLIFMMYGEHAYEALLGFGFGGTLLALFMRVGGGIYTKAADVGADLVGKIEQDIPEDDPRNAATIADNVGDNVGDCAGMAADIFESYEVTIVAAMILGWASFGHKGVMFPILVRAIGVIGSIISTYTVRAKADGSSGEAMKQINKGFMIGSAISRHRLHHPGLVLPPLQRRQRQTGSPQASSPALVGHLRPGSGLDMRPAWTCFIGIILAMVLNKVTSTSRAPTHAPVKSLTRPARPATRTNIIEGFAVGYESTVVNVIVIAIAIAISVLMLLRAPNPIFIAYGVAMWGIGMLTLTGNTISMDVFGPIADNANGIAEMGFDKERDGSRTKPSSTSTPGRSSPTSTRWATPPRPSPRASPSARPSSRPSPFSPPSSPSSRWAARTRKATVAPGSLPTISPACSPSPRRTCSSA